MARTSTYDQTKMQEMMGKVTFFFFFLGAPEPSKNYVTLDEENGFRGKPVVSDTVPL